MKLTQNPLHLAILVATSLVLFTGASNAEGIQCPPGKQSVEAPEASGNYHCIKQVCIADVASIQSLYSGTTGEQTASQADADASMAGVALAIQNAEMALRMKQLQTEIEIDLLR